MAGNLTPILTLRRMCCLGAPIALLWRFRELPEDLASYGPLPGLLSAAASLLSSCSVVALLLCVVAFSSLLPFCCNHFALCPFLWSLPPSFYLYHVPEIPFKTAINPPGWFKCTTEMLNSSLRPVGHIRPSSRLLSSQAIRFPAIEERKKSVEIKARRHLRPSSW